MVKDIALSKTLYESLRDYIKEKHPKPVDKKRKDIRVNIAINHENEDETKIEWKEKNNSRDTSTSSPLSFAGPHVIDSTLSNSNSDTILNFVSYARKRRRMMLDESSFAEITEPEKTSIIGDEWKAMGIQEKISFFKDN